MAFIILHLNSDCDTRFARLLPVVKVMTLLWAFLYYEHYQIAKERCPLGAPLFVVLYDVIVLLCVDVGVSGISFDEVATWTDFIAH